MSASPKQAVAAGVVDPERIARLFPSDFVWGVATSAFQIEGTEAGDGRGASIWDTFCARHGTIIDGTDGREACQHLRYWESDLDLIAALGITHYRFSVSWPRVQPLGVGAWNDAGLAFYDRLVDGMLARGIQPHVTLYHWDLPEALQASGGWQSRATVGHFVDYARRMGALLGDRAATIATHNEPWVVATLGHQQGIFAPGVKSRAAAAQVAHHLLLSHGAALAALRADGVSAKLGIVLNQAPVHPATVLVEDRTKARLKTANSSAGTWIRCSKDRIRPTSWTRWGRTHRWSKRAISTPSAHRSIFSESITTRATLRSPKASTIRTRAASS
jgi:beta-glucosidase